MIYSIKDNTQAQFVTQKKFSGWTKFFNLLYVYISKLSVFKFQHGGCVYITTSAFPGQTIFRYTFPKPLLSCCHKHMTNPEKIVHKITPRHLFAAALKTSVSGMLENGYSGRSQNVFTYQCISTFLVYCSGERGESICVLRTALTRAHLGHAGVHLNTYNCIMLSYHYTTYAYFFSALNVKVQYKDIN